MRARLLIGLLVLLAAGAFGVQQVTAAPPCTITFDGGGGTAAWATAANWDTDVVPGTADHVCIPAGQTALLTTASTVQTVQAAGALTISSAGALTLTDSGNESTVQTFTMTAGDVLGAGGLAVTGTGTWSGGDMQGTGTTRIAEGATLTVSGGSPYLYVERGFEIAGTLTIASAHGINDWNGIPTMHVASTGRIVGAAPSGTAYVDPAVDNDGVVLATSAILNLNGGSGTGTSAGDFGGGTGFVDVKVIGQTQTLAEGAQLLGNVRLAGGSVAIAAGAVATASGDNVMSSGDLAGPGTLSYASGAFAVSGGSMKDGLALNVAQPASMTVAGGSPYLYADSTIDVAGTLTIASAHGINDWNGIPTMHVASTGRIVGGAPDGTTAHVDPAVDNDGEVLATSGILSLNGGSGAGMSAGDFGGGTGFVDVKVIGQTQTLADGARLLGGVRLAGGKLAVADGAVATATGDNVMSSGNLAGPGTLSYGSGAFAVSGGSMMDALTLNVAQPASMTVDGGSPYLYVDSTIDVAGTLTIASAHGINDWNGVPTMHVGSTGRIVGAAPTGTTAFVDPAVDNDGVVTATSGVLNLNGGSGTGSSAGDFGGGEGFVDVKVSSRTQTLAGGARLVGRTRVSGGAVAIADGATATVSGAGNALVSGTIGGTGTLSIASGAFTVSGGTMSGAGVTDVATGATMTLTGTMALASGRTLKVAGLLDIAGDAGIGRSAAPPEPLVHVLDGGELRKSAGTVTGWVDPELRNDGLVASAAGRLELRRGAAAAHTGDFQGAGDTAVASLRTGTHVLGAGARLLGYAEIGGGTVTIPAGVTIPAPGTLRHAGGVLAGAGTVDVTGTLVWTGGTQTGPGTTRIAPAATLTVDGCNVTLRDGRRIDVDGVMRLVRQSDVYSYGTPAPVIAVADRLEIDDTDTSACGTVNGIYGNAIVRNTGTVEKVAGATVSRIDSVLDNDGLVRSNAGVLELSSDAGVAHAGAFGADAAGGTVEFTYGDFVLEPGAHIAGDAAIAYAEVVIPEDVTVAVGAGRTFTQTGGSLSGPGELRVLGTLLWTGGQQDGGTTVVEPGGSATLGGDEYAYRSLSGSRVLVNRGTVSLTVGELYVQDGSSILNHGTLDLGDGTSIGGDGFYGYGGSLVHNTGRLRKPAGTGTASLQAVLDNDGTVEAAAGMLALEGQMLNAGHDDSLTGGTWIARNATIGVREPVAVNAARLVLDGDQAKLMTIDWDGAPVADALAGLARNAGAGRLELQGGRDLALPGPFRNGGTVRAGEGSTVSVAGAYEQSGGLTSLAPTARLSATGAQVRLTGGRLAGHGSAGPDVLVEGGVLEGGTAGAGALTLDALELAAGATTRARVSATGAGTLQVTGAAALAGTLEVIKSADFQPVSGTEILLGSFGTRTGAITAVTGDPPGPGLQWQLVSGATDLKLRAAAVQGERAAAPPEPADVHVPASAPQPAPARRVRIDDSEMVVGTGRWTRRNGVAIARRRGATLLRRGVQGRRLSIVAATCRTCGTVQVFWRGRLVREVSLRSRHRGRRVIRVRSYARTRSGTVRLRASSARRVAIDALIVR